MNEHDPSAKSREAAVFKSNRSQAVRIPKELAFPEGVKKVTITPLADGSLVLRPAKKSTWAEYFSRPSLADADFLDDRAQGEWDEREPL